MPNLSWSWVVVGCVLFLSMCGSLLWENQQKTATLNHCIEVTKDVKNCGRQVNGGIQMEFGTDTKPETKP